MPSLKQVLPSTSTVHVPFGLFSLTVTYRPGAVTPRLQKAIAAARDTSDLEAGLLAPVCKLVVAWDLTDDDGDPIPIEPEHLADVPAAVLLAVMQAIGADLAPNPTSGADSSNGSSQTASSAPLQTGTPS